MQFHAVPLHAQLVQYAADILHAGHGALGLRLRQQDGEFIAAKACRAVDDADCFEQMIRDEFEAGIAALMAVQVVERLEAVKIDDDEERAGRVAAADTRQLLAEKGFKAAAIHEARQGIGGGEVFQLADALFLRGNQPFGAFDFMIGIAQQRNGRRLRAEGAILRREVALNILERQRAGGAKGAVGPVGRRRVIFFCHGSGPCCRYRKAPPKSHISIT